MTNNKNIETLIKLRHLAEGLKSNWELLKTSQKRATNMFNEANNLMQTFGTKKGKTVFQEDLDILNFSKHKINSQLEGFREMIELKSTSNSLEMYKEFQLNTKSISSLFAKIGKYPDDHFTEIEGADWFGIWAVIQSNIYIVQGIGHSAFVQLQMFEKFNQKEIDDLSKEIIKYIPKSYYIDDAIQYKKEYLTALEQMEEESNKKDNLWDRFLNFLAGNVPFKQTPQERVMMMRWVNGEKGEL